ncbi:hypothetical protein GCM10010441_39440 [Kitasatospora paracochleata]|uniref:ESAT-6 protein secretion system EspG family protein n=1 Tax=Kitasatospora paracochleata TaxID=58354 RepID=A0ABT1JAT9_9ACTN|nr:hypothetical protein [Kitasatospora paracochleata]MCP2314234.1 hypothetical protein [Kitasatospora paracochleata]MCP2314669.1 hypothetical protein [Kitasatospora paracochleata]
MRISIGGDHVEVPDGLGRALLAALREERLVEPPQVAGFDDLVDLVASLSRLIQHLTVFKEVAISRADAAGAYSNRRALALAAAMSASQLGRVLEGHGLPKDRRSGGVNLVVAFRAADDGVLHLAAEADVAGLPEFTLPFTPTQTTAERTEFSGRELTFYYRPQVSIAAADLGRSAGYTLRDAEHGLIACVTEDVFDALFGDPRLDPTRPNGR